MMRDLTMIAAVLISVVSVSFGVYKNFEASNNHAFIYQQAYQIINKIQTANIPPATKNQLTASALGVLGTPVPVLDFSQSSAAPIDERACSVAQENSCGSLASQLASANAACSKSKGVAADCVLAGELKSSIVAQGCFVCYSQ